MHLDFLLPRVDRLAADGTTEVLHNGGLLGRLLRQPVTLLARDLCSFALFEAANLPRHRRRQAARLHARLSAPYLHSGYTLAKSGGDYGLWWWDEERLTPLVQALPGGAKRVLVPETLAQPKWQSWRIVRLRQGYEAQLWRNQSLIATAFRRDRFDAPSWSAFVRLQRAAEEAPALPPAPLDLPIAYSNREAFAPPPIELNREQSAWLAGGAAAVACLSLGAYFYGQGATLAEDGLELEQQTQAIRASTPQPEAVRDMDTNQKTLIAYHQIEGRTNPLTSAGAAIGILALHELTPDVVDAKDGSLSLTLKYQDLPLIEELVEDFETSGYFYEITPRADAAAKSLILDMKVRESAEPLVPET